MTTTLLVRSDASREPLVNAIRGKIAELDPTLAVSGILSMDSVIAASVAQPRMRAQLVVAFASFALLLASVGMYGVMAYAVSARKQEMGIRMSLGANPRDVLRLVVTRGMRLALEGLILGLLASLGLTRLLGSLLFGVRVDPLVCGGAALVLLTSALRPATCRGVAPPGSIPSWFSGSSRGALPPRRFRLPRVPETQAPGDVRAIVAGSCFSKTPRRRRR